MKKMLLLLLTATNFCHVSFSQGSAKILITGVFDGPLFGGQPKGIELFVIEDIADLSIYGAGSANNGGGTDSVEFSFPAVPALKNTFLYLTQDSAGFRDFFGFNANFVDAGTNSSVAINGDDAMELFESGTVIDVFGQIDVDGSGTAWDYLDGWVYRKDGTGPDGSNFSLSNWIFSGIDVFDNQTTNATSPKPFPIGTYKRSLPSQITANDDFLRMKANSSGSVNLAANDVLPNGVFNALTIWNQSPNGTHTLLPTGLFTFTPNQDYCGRDTMLYSICWAGACDTAKIIIEVECPFVYPVYPIAVVRTNKPTGEPDSIGVKCELSGVVYGVNLRPAGLQFTLIDDNNAGIGVFSSAKNFGYSVQEGDGVTVRGTIGHFRGLTQINLDTVFKTSSNNTLFSPRQVFALDETTESQLIEVKNLVVPNPSQWTNMGSGFEVDVTDGTNNYKMFVDADTDLFGKSLIPFSFNLTGIGGQFDASSPFTEGYQIIPRYFEDMDYIVSAETPEWAEGITISPNPASAFLTINGISEVDRIEIFDATGKKLTSVVLKTGSVKIDANNWQSGLYMVGFQKGSEVWFQKFIVLK